MRSIVLVGTSHKYQRPETPGSDLFKAYLESLCADRRIVGIAEEMSLEGLAQNGSSESVAKQLANQASIAHRYCDMETAQRRSAGVEDVQHLQLRAFFCEWQPDRLAEEIRFSASRREAHWLRQIVDLNVWPLIFVCGADHVESFGRLLNANDCSATIANADWGQTDE